MAAGQGPGRHGQGEDPRRGPRLGQEALQAEGHRLGPARRREVPDHGRRRSVARPGAARLRVRAAEEGPQEGAPLGPRLRAKQDRIIVLDKFPVAGGKSKAVSTALKALGAAKKALIVDAPTNADLIQGTRNLASSKWLAPAGLNVYDVLHADTLILTRDVVATIQDALRPSARS